MGKKGYTLIELIIVMTIIAIAATMMVPSMKKWTQSYRLRSATRDVVSTLRSAQMSAISTNTTYGVAFDANDFQMYQSTGGLIPKGLQITLPTGVTFANNSFPVNGTLGKRFAQFNPDSSCTNAGSITVVGANGTRRITVTTSTGRISIQ